MLAVRQSSLGSPAERQSAKRSAPEIVIWPSLPLHLSVCLCGLCVWRQLCCVCVSQGFFGVCLNLATASGMLGRKGAQGLISVDFAMAAVKVAFLKAQALQTERRPSLGKTKRNLLLW